MSCTTSSFTLFSVRCFCKSVRWCGRILSSEGVNFDLRRREGLFNMEGLINGAHLQEILRAMQYVRQGIQPFTKIMEPLHEFMERLYDRASKGKNRAGSLIQLNNYVWGPDRQRAFQSCMNALLHQVTFPIATNQSALRPYGRIRYTLVLCCHKNYSRRH